MGWKQADAFAELLDKCSSSLSKNTLDKLVHLALNDATHGYKDVCAQLERHMKHSPARGKARLNVLYVMSAIMRRSKKQEKAKDKYCPRLLPRLESIAGHLSELPSPYWAAVAKIVRVWRADRLLPEEALAHFAGFSSQPADSSGQPSPSGSGQEVPPERSAAPAAEPSNGAVPALPQLPAGLAQHLASLPPALGAPPQPLQPPLPPAPLQTGAAEGGRKRRSRWEDGSGDAPASSAGAALAPAAAPAGREPPLPPRPPPPVQPPPLPDRPQAPAAQPPPWAAAPQQQAAPPAFAQPPPWQLAQQAQAQQAQAPPWQHAARTGSFHNSAPAQPPPRPPALPRPISLPPPRPPPAAPPAAPAAPPAPPPPAQHLEQQRAAVAVAAALRGEAAALAAGLTGAAAAQLHGAPPGAGPEPPRRKRSRWEDGPPAAGPQAEAERAAADSSASEAAVGQPRARAAESQLGANGGVAGPAAAAKERLAGVPEEAPAAAPKGEPDWSSMELPGLLDSL